jgi:hypothetical protein
MLYFQTKKSQFGQILECLTVKDVRKFYGRLSILLPLRIFHGHFGNFSCLGILHNERSGNPGICRVALC